MTREIVLDLFAGAGGSARGFLRLGYDVVGVDVDPNPRYPAECIEADLEDGLPERVLELVEDPDVRIAYTWASPPCQGITTLPGCDAPQLIPLARELAEEIGAPYMIENLEGAKRLLEEPVELSGAVEAFDLEVRKTRLVETSFPVEQPELAEGRTYAFALSARETPITGYREAHGFHRLARLYDSDIRQAIPPAYVAYLVAEHRGEPFDAVHTGPLPPEGVEA